MNARAGQLGWAAALTLALALLLSSCLWYGGREIEPGASGFVQTEHEHCAVNLPAGWTWRPASWTGVSPLGTEMGFSEALLGRPQHPTWDEWRTTALQPFIGKAQIDESDNGDTIRIDFGPDGGLSYIHKFDRVACQMTFALKSKSVRAQEQDQWEAIIASLQRTTPHS